MSAWQDRNRDDEIAKDADEAEWRAVRLGSTNIDSGAANERIAGEFEDLCEEEFRTGRIAEEIVRRQEIMQDSYPFEQDGNAIRHRQSSTGVYEFCLAVSFLESLSRTDSKKYQIAFERLTRETLTCYLGGPAGVQAFRTGMPDDPLEERPTGIKAIIERISQAAGNREWVWNPDRGYPQKPRHNDLGDLEIDVVVWRSLPDRRGGHQFILGQCACGLSTWEDKFHEPDAERLKSWCQVGDVPFCKAFAIPFHVPNETYFGEVSRRTKAVVFDRARIAVIAEANNGYIGANAREGYFYLAGEALNSPHLTLAGTEAGQQVRTRRRRKGGEGRRSQSP